MTPAPIDHPALAAGRTAVITGGGGGIGLAVARRCAAAGMRICIADKAPGLEAAADELRAAGAPEVLARTLDVADAAALMAFAEEVFARFGEVGLLLNNAAVAGDVDVLGGADIWQRVLGINLFGVLNGVQAFAPLMLAQGRAGLIVNTGSKQGITTPPGDTAYNVSKAGVKVLTEGLAHTLRSTPGAELSAHLLIPGFTFTGMTARHRTEKPPGAWTPEQVADALVTGLLAGDFYILCADNETPRALDEKRILWAAGDIVENRPALSRWHPDYKEAFAAFARGAE